jgi:putative transposase
VAHLLAPNLAMEIDEADHRIRFLVRDRDAKFTAAFDAVFTAIDVRITKTPVQAPRGPMRSPNALLAASRRKVLDRVLIINDAP